MTIKLIVGPANPGAEYAATRHNAGARYVDLLADRHRAPLREEQILRLHLAHQPAGEDVRLLVPTTFMNLSGKAVAAMATFIASTLMKFWSPMTSWIYRRAWRNLSLAVAMAATMA
nr:Peptidyl-tRNA hydrolase [Klebsiella pneumoniae]